MKSHLKDHSYFYSPLLSPLMTFMKHFYKDLTWRNISWKRSCMKIRMPFREEFQPNLWGFSGKEIGFLQYVLISFGTEALHCNSSSSLEVFIRFHWRLCNLPHIFNKLNICLISVHFCLRNKNYQFSLILKQMKCERCLQQWYFVA